MSTITPEELRAISARAEKASPAPWRLHNTEDPQRSDWVNSIVDERGGFVICPDREMGYEAWDNDADAEFIAHAREDVPKLVATIEALQAEVEQLHEAAGWLREQEESLRADIDELDKENKQLQAERDGLAATLEQVRAWLAYKPTASLHDIVAAAPSVSLAHVKAETLREAAEDMAAVIHNGDVAECAAFVPGESGRSAAVEARDSIYEEPAEWLAKYADQIESEASNE